ncbi:MAG: hypothetical protein UV38_C0001G0037 [candidate division TM6 bacterium GW2011_GWE2_42_60]|nr:MAG: hypothetical protein UV38_C0001G0037 [candidate division TM6 bacterium GW2011_GWE2_42_60]
MKIGRKKHIKSYFFLFIVLVALPMLSEEVEIPLTEDLMREHGIISRVCLLCENGIKRIDNHEDFPAAVFNDVLHIIESFIEDYHEKLEENYIFPLFEKNKIEVALVKTLRDQHNKGRKMRGKLQKIIEGKRILSWRIKGEIKHLLWQFITMYRPHAAREDTVLFPQIRSLMSEEAFKELGEKFDDLERESLGEGGFETTVQSVERIEKQLGIYQLEQFSPA